MLNFTDVVIHNLKSMHTDFLGVTHTNSVAIRMNNKLYSFIVSYNANKVLM